MHWSLQAPSSNNTREDSTHGYHQMVNTKMRLIIFFAAKNGEALIVSKNKMESWLWLDHELLIAKFRLKWKKVGKTYFEESRENHWRRRWQPTPVLLPGKSHGRRSLVGYSLWGREESDTTERLHFHFSLSCIGEGNGNPLQCSCLENPRDRGGWWAAIYGVAQSQTWLKWLSSSRRENQ